MEDVKKKILERLKKLSEEEREKREQIQESKMEGGDSVDNQDYQFNLESLMRIKQEKSNLQSRLEEMENEELQLTSEKKPFKIKPSNKNLSIPIIGKEFELLVNDSKKIKVRIVSLYEEIENNQEYYSVTTESPLAKILEKMISKFLIEFEKKIEKLINSETDNSKLIRSIESMNEWIAIDNHQKFIKKLKEISKDKNKLTKEIDSFLKQAEIDSSKVFQAIKGWEFNIKINEKDIKYKIIDVN